MDSQQYKKWVKYIQVSTLENNDVKVKNNSPLEMIGKGRQGAVFKVNDDICLKVFGNSEDCDREHYALSLGQKTSLFPRIYEKGSNFIAMEFVKGVDLREYLQSQPLTPELSAKLIEMLIIFKEIGFERIDHHKRQIYLQLDGSLKVIDVARTVWRDRVYPYPRKLLTSLGDKNKDLFLSHVQAMAPELYEEWKHYIRMEQLSRHIYDILIESPTPNDTFKTLSKKLLTTKDEKTYVAKLEGLVNKVFKEEWIKTMLARGIDPNIVMEKIDKYLESRNNERGRDYDWHHEKGKHSGHYRHREKDKHHGHRRHHEKDRHHGHHRHHEKGRHHGHHRSRGYVV